MHKTTAKCDLDNHRQIEYNRKPWKILEILVFKKNKLVSHKSVFKKKLGKGKFNPFIFHTSNRKISNLGLFTIIIYKNLEFANDAVNYTFFGTLKKN